MDIITFLRGIKSLNDFQRILEFPHFSNNVYFDESTSVLIRNIFCFDFKDSLLSKKIPFWSLKLFKIILANIEDEEIEQFHEEMLCLFKYILKQMDNFITLPNGQTLFSGIIAQIIPIISETVSRSPSLRQAVVLHLRDWFLNMILSISLAFSVTQISFLVNHFNACLQSLPCPPKIEPYQSCKLGALICSCGDYPLQLRLLELHTFLGLKPTLPPGRSYSHIQANISEDNFDADCRRFLNEINSSELRVVSFQCSELAIGNITIRDPLWVDWNHGSLTVSLACDRRALGLSPGYLEPLTLRLEEVRDIKHHGQQLSLDGAPISAGSPEACTLLETQTPRLVMTFLEKRGPRLSQILRLLKERMPPQIKLYQDQNRESSQFKFQLPAAAEVKDIPLSANRPSSQNQHSPPTKMSQLMKDMDIRQSDVKYHPGVSAIPEESTETDLSVENLLRDLNDVIPATPPAPDFHHRKVSTFGRFETPTVQRKISSFGRLETPMLRRKVSVVHMKSNTTAEHSPKAHVKNFGNMADSDIYNIRPSQIPILNKRNEKDFPTNTKLVDSTLSIIGMKVLDKTSLPKILFKETERSRNTNEKFMAIDIKEHKESMIMNKWSKTMKILDLQKKNKSSHTVKLIVNPGISESTSVVKQTTLDIKNNVEKSTTIKKIPEKNPIKSNCTAKLNLNFNISKTNSFVKLFKDKSIDNLSQKNDVQPLPLKNREEESVQSTSLDYCGAETSLLPAPAPIKKKLNLRLRSMQEVKVANKPMTKTSSCIVPLKERLRKREVIIVKSRVPQDTIEVGVKTRKKKNENSMKQIVDNDITIQSDVSQDNITGAHASSKKLDSQLTEMEQKVQFGLSQESSTSYKLDNKPAEIEQNVHSGLSHSEFSIKNKLDSQPTEVEPKVQSSSSQRIFEHKHNNSAATRSKNRKKIKLHLKARSKSLKIEVEPEDLEDNLMVIDKDKAALELCKIYDLAARDTSPTPRQEMATDNSPLTVQDKSFIEELEDDKTTLMKNVKDSVEYEVEPLTQPKTVASKFFSVSCGDVLDAKTIRRINSSGSESDIYIPASSRKTPPPDDVATSPAMLRNKKDDLISIEKVHISNKGATNTRKRNTKQEKTFKKNQVTKKALKRLKNESPNLKQNSLVKDDLVKGLNIKSPDRDLPPNEANVTKRRKLYSAKYDDPDLSMYQCPSEEVIPSPLEGKNKQPAVSNNSRVVQDHSATSFSYRRSSDKPTPREIKISETFDSLKAMGPTYPYVQSVESLHDQYRFTDSDSDSSVKNVKLPQPESTAASKKREKLTAKTKVDSKKIMKLPMKRKRKRELTNDDISSKLDMVGNNTSLIDEKVRCNPCNMGSTVMDDVPHEDTFLDMTQSDFEDDMPLEKLKQVEMVHHDPHADIPKFNKATKQTSSNLISVVKKIKPIKSTTHSKNSVNKSSVFSAPPTLDTSLPNLMVENLPILKHNDSFEGANIMERIVNNCPMMDISNNSLPLEFDKEVAEIRSQLSQSSVLTIDALVDGPQTKDEQVKVEQKQISDDSDNLVLADTPLCDVQLSDKEMSVDALLKQMSECRVNMMQNNRCKFTRSSTLQNSFSESPLIHSSQSTSSCKTDSTLHPKDNMMMAIEEEPILHQIEKEPKKIPQKQPIFGFDYRKYVKEISPASSPELNYCDLSPLELDSLHYKADSSQDMSETLGKLQEVSKIFNNEALKQYNISSLESNGTSVKPLLPFVKLFHQPKVPKKYKAFSSKSKAVSFPDPQEKSHASSNSMEGRKQYEEMAMSLICVKEDLLRANHLNLSVNQMISTVLDRVDRLHQSLKSQIEFE